MGQHGLWGKQTWHVPFLLLPSQIPHTVGLKTILTYYFTVCMWPGSAGSLIQGSQAQNQGVREAEIFPGHWESICFWAVQVVGSSGPFRCRTEIPISSLAVNKQTFSASRAHSFFVSWPSSLILETSNSGLNSSPALNYSAILVPLSLMGSSACKDHVIPLVLPG